MENIKECSKKLNEMQEEYAKISSFLCVLRSYYPESFDGYTFEVFANFAGAFELLDELVAKFSRSFNETVDELDMEVRRLG